MRLAFFAGVLTNPSLKSRRRLEDLPDVPGDEPGFRVVGGAPGRAKRRVGGDPSPSQHDFVDPARRHAQGQGQPVLAEAQM